MTREERTRLIKHLKYNRSIGADYLITDKDADEIIKALEQELCEDAVSRSEVLDLMQLRMIGKELYKAIYEMPSVVPKSDWISVNEGLPEKNGSYLVQVTSSDGTATITFMMVEHYNEDGTWLHCDNKRRKVVAWMPLPEPYTESEDKG